MYYNLSVNPIDSVFGGITEIWFEIGENDIAEAIRRGEKPPSKSASVLIDLSELSSADRALIAERFDEGWIYQLRSKNQAQRSEDVIVAHQDNFEGLMSAVRADDEQARQIDELCGL